MNSGIIIRCWKNAIPEFMNSEMVLVSKKKCRRELARELAMQTMPFPAAEWSWWKLSRCMSEFC